MVKFSAIVDVLVLAFFMLQITIITSQGSSFKPDKANANLLAACTKTCSRKTPSHC
ncbi:hypothetical protein CASFOL_031307 [Castilleja foliolosa]|uniref:Uncharacterized protein n=1 Tax=Castilleja foliolosa TaxID=1961234 RepID=A0ABD3C5Q8_9LAMI